MGCTLNVRRKAGPLTRGKRGAVRLTAEGDNTMAKYPKTLGRIEAVWNKLGGEEGVDRFLRGELTVSAPTRVWKTWKTIKLGTGLKTANDFRKALRASGFWIGDWANDILGKPAFTAATKESELELVKVSVEELGFKNGATRQEICQRAQELGLELCPNEVDPQLRRQYPDQPYGEWLIVAMEPIIDSVGFLGVFGVEHDGSGQWLYGHCDGPEGVWSAGVRGLFVRRK